MKPNCEKPILYQNRRRTIRAYLVISALITISSITASVAAQEVCPGVRGHRDTYLPLTGELRTNALDHRTDPNDPYHRVQLQGTIHYPPGDTLKNRPALIFNHGHERERSEACAIVRYFTDKGWIVFAPLRRGHLIPGTGDAVGIRSTGIYVDDFVDFCSRSQDEVEDPDNPVDWVHLYRGSPFCRPNAPTDPVERRSAVELFYLREQRIDVRDAITYLKSRAAISPGVIVRNWKLVDAQNIVILGHSYGGALTVFANEEDYGQSAAVDIQGAELSWDNDDDPYWRIDLKDAMPSQERPIYFLQPKNGRFLAPTKVLFGLAVDWQYRSQAAIFPPAACLHRNPFTGSEMFPPCDEAFGAENKQIHTTFIGHDEQVARWGPSVIEFAKRNSR